MNYDYLYDLMYQNAHKFCKDCPMSGYRCCVKQACEQVRDHECTPLIKALFDEKQEVPFMGPTGCLVPPHQRPTCTTFVCHMFMASKYYQTHLALIKILPFRIRKETLVNMNRLAKLFSKTAPR